MVADISRIEHFHGKFAPSAVRLQLFGVELVVQQAALTAHFVSVEIVRLQAIYHSSAPIAPLANFTVVTLVVSYS